MTRRVQFRAEDPLTRAAGHVAPWLRRRDIHLYYDVNGPTAWLDGDPLALERSVQRLLHGAADAIESGVVFLTAEVARIDPSHCSLTVRCGASGPPANATAIEAVVQRLELLPDMQQDNGYLHAKGSCPATGAHVRMTLVPAECMLLSLFHIAEGRVGDEPVADAEGARAWLLMDQDAAFESLCLRLQRLGWAITRLPTVDEVLARHREFEDAGRARPRLVVARESKAVPLADAARLARTLGAGAGACCLLLVDLGSASLAPTQDPALQVCVAPLPPSELDRLTRELAPQADRPSGHTDPMPLSEAHRPLVLVVDDDPITRLMVSNLLRLLGLDGAEVADGIEALEWCQARSPDLVLMDINMPRMNGIEATRALRQRQRRGELAHFPIVMVTSTTDPGAWQASQSLGVEGYLAKPLTLDRLKHQVACHVLRR